MNFARLEKAIMRDEGYRSRPYLDTVNVPTIGYGSTYILGIPVSLDMPALSITAARDLLRAELFTSLIDAQALFSRFDEMDSVRQEVLANMAYNLGRSRLGNFRKLIKHGENLAYQRMAEEMVDSKWYRQVGFRSRRLVAEMRSGEVV